VNGRRLASRPLPAGASAARLPDLGFAKPGTPVFGMCGALGASNLQ
jgi:hypothetical protein